MFVDADEVDVEVDNDLAILSGTVDSKAEPTLLWKMPGRGAQPRSPVSWWSK